MAMLQDYKKYDANEIENIKMSLEAEAREGKPLSFEVKVDDYMRIHRTDKVERFDEIYNFINENTRSLIVGVFPNGNNKKKEWYKFHFGAASKSLNGFETEKSVSEQVSEAVQLQMSQHKEREAAKRLEEKLAETTEKLEQAETYIEDLQNQLEESKTKTNHIGNWDLGKLAGSTIKEIAIHYPKILDNIPVLNGIKNVIQEDEKQRPRQSESSFEGEVSFKPKSQTSQAGSDMQKHEESVKQLSEFISEHFDDQNKLILGWVIEALGENPSQLRTVAELLNINISEKMLEYEQEL